MGEPDGNALNAASVSDEDLCAHGCGFGSLVQHADGRALCPSCYAAEVDPGATGTIGCPTCSPSLAPDSDSGSAGARSTAASTSGPYLIIAAFWQDEDNTDAVAEAVRTAKSPDVPGYSRGAVVAFRREVADSWDFRRDLERLDLGELNERPKERHA